MDFYKIFNWNKYPTLTKIIIYFGANLVLCEAGHLSQIENEASYVIWPLIGFMYAALLLCKKKNFPVYMLASFIAEIVVDWQFGVLGKSNVCAYAVNIFVAAGAAIIIRKYLKQTEYLADIKNIAGIVVLPSFAIPIIGGTIAYVFVAQGTSIPAYLKEFEAAWIGQMLGIIIFAPLTLFVVIAVKRGKLFEDKFKKSYQLLDSILDSVEDGILTIDVNKKIKAYNKKFLELWAIPPELAELKNNDKLIEHVLDQLIEPEIFVPLVKRRNANLEETSLDFIKLIDGRIFEQYAKPLIINNKAAGKVWSFRDITNQRIAENELIKSRDTYLRVLDNAPALIWRSGIDAQCNWFNKAWLEFTGKPMKEEIGFGWADGVFPDDLNRCIELYKEAFAVKKPFEMEYRIKRNDGKYRWISDYGKPNYDLKNEFTGYIGYCFDITDRRETDAQLIENEKITSELLSNIPEIILVHTGGHIVFMNKIGESVLGCQPKEAVGKRIFDFVDENYYEVVEKNMNKRLAGEKIEDYEIMLKTKNNGKMCVAVRATIINYKNEKALLAILIDVSELKNYEDKLVELNATKDKLLSIISHDLKGPFHGFLGVSDLLANQIENLEPEEIKLMAGELNRSLKKQYQLLQDLLNWTKMQNNGIKYEQKKLRLSEEFQIVLQSVEGNAHHKNLTITTAMKDEIEINADPNMLQIILRNLISNAIKFSYPGGNINIEAQNNKNEIVISVADNGVGIEEYDMERLFKINSRFSNDGTDNEQGSGLGLIFCKELMEKHNGTIRCESEKNKGSKFIIAFPVLH
jgi:PAS domain S-box-containing protein